MYTAKICKQEIKEKKMKEMKAIVFKGVEQVEYETVPIPEVLVGWTLVKISHAGICGSDMTIYHGKHPRAKAPLIMGHEFSGYVESEHPEFAKGTLVTCFPYKKISAHFISRKNKMATLLLPSANANKIKKIWIYVKKLR